MISARLRFAAISFQNKKCKYRAPNLAGSVPKRCLSAPKISILANSKFPAFSSFSMPMPLTALSENCAPRFSTPTSFRNFSSKVNSSLARRKAQILDTAESKSVKAPTCLYFGKLFAPCSIIQRRFYAKKDKGGRKGSRYKTAI